MASPNNRPPAKALSTTGDANGGPQGRGSARGNDGTLPRVQFEMDQRLPGPPDAVLAALLDRRFWDAVGEVATQAKPELLDQDRRGRFVRQRVRFRFVAPLPTAAQAVLDPARLSFVQNATIDCSAHTARFLIQPDHYADRLKADGSWSVGATTHGSERHYQVNLQVNYPLVSKLVERAILSGLESYSVEEEGVLRQWLDGDHRSSETPRGAGTPDRIGPQDAR